MGPSPRARRDIRPRAPGHYLAGISVVMIVGRLRNVSGVPVEGDTVPAEVVSFASGLVGVHAPTVAVAGTVFALLVVLGLLLPRLPGPLIAVLLAAAVTAVACLDALGVRHRSGRAERIDEDLIFPTPADRRRRLPRGPRPDRADQGPT
ncbi:hypothetical protein [Pseudonocardia humida]|uniref:Uncharacterized protein n=1 Tax=Pseudonocardia humida TaxID=2800819 RepID=A0ABT1A003_9PSEU|nr:hypothetical protein [Pseudonocardia humida]MCO1656335.1 hypothetical protein [Pseudonocardia humida]